jgi:mono/diheme cytochrome c family protein
MARRKALSVAFCTLVISAVTVAIGVPSAGSTAVQDRAGSLGQEEARKLKSPVPFNKESIARGRTLFARYCTECHGADGKAMVDVIANATDLTEPKLWRNGTSEGEVYRSILDGAGLTMPSYKSQIRNEEDLWHLVNFIRSLWPEPLRPKLQEGKAN